MPDANNGVGGAALYNLLQTANQRNFNSDAFAVKSGSASIDANNVVSPTNLNSAINPDNPSSQDIAQLLAADNAAAVKSGSTKYQYDIFNRLSFGSVPNSASANSGFAGNTFEADRIVSRNQNIDNRVIINYKNQVTVEKLSQDPNDTTFVNKIKTVNRFTGNNYKDPSIDVIVEGLSGHPTSKISYADFLYCKKLGAYPNNRLVILRRFFQPIDDDLFDSNFANVQQNPISVMVTWFDEFPFEIKYGEDWSKRSTGIIEEFSNTLSSLAPTKVKKAFDFLNPFAEAAASKTSNGRTNITSPWLKTLWYQFIDGLYKNNSNNIPPNFKNVLTEANPNLIRDSVIKQGLTFSVNLTLSFTYVMRYINGIDPHVAMHNIIANAVRMGTSTSVTIFPRTSQAIPEFVKDLNQGKVISALEVVYRNVSSYLKGLFDDAKNTVTNTSSKDVINALSGDSVSSIFKEIDSNSYSKQLFSLYRFQLTAALQADLGIPSGSWHVTVGNPFNPIASMGDLVISSSGGMSMKFNNELSYNDQPTEATFTISLENARPRGAQEIEQIFNAGRGRIYVYPQYDDDPDLYLSDVNPTNSSANNSNSNINVNDVAKNIKTN